MTLPRSRSRGRATSRSTRSTSAWRCVRIDALNRSRGVASRVLTNVRRVTRLRAALKAFRPDAVVAFTTEANVVAIWSALGLGLPVVVSERNQPDRPGLGRFTRAARRLSYPLAAALVVQTEAIANGAVRASRPRSTCCQIRFALRHGAALRTSRRKQKQIVAAGRLVPQKGFDVLIASFAALAAAYPDWRLVIYGEGVQREALEAEARRLRAWREDRAAGHPQGYARGLGGGRFVRAAVAL